MADTDTISEPTSLKDIFTKSDTRKDKIELAAGLLGLVGLIFVLASGVRYPLLSEDYDDEYDEGVVEGFAGEPELFE